MHTSRSTRAAAHMYEKECLHSLKGFFKSLEFNFYASVCKFFAWEVFLLLLSYPAYR